MSVKRKLIRALKISLGIFLLLVAIPMGPAPFLQGWIVALIGLAILYQEVAWVRKMVHRLRERFPRFAHAYDRVLQRLHECRERHRAGESWRRALACCFSRSKPDEAPQQEEGGHGAHKDNRETQAQ